MGAGVVCVKGGGRLCEAGAGSGAGAGGGVMLGGGVVRARSGG